MRLEYAVGFVYGDAGKTFEHKQIDAVRSYVPVQVYLCFFHELGGRTQVEAKTDGERHDRFSLHCLRVVILDFVEKRVI